MDINLGGNTITEGYFEGILERVLSSNDGTISIDTNNRQLLDSSGDIVIDWSNTGYNSSAALSFDGVGDAFIRGKVVIEGDGIVTSYPYSLSIDTNNRQLIDSAGDISIGWNSRLMVDSDGQNVIDWENHHLNDTSDGTPSLCWDLRQLMYTDGTTVILDWSQGYAYDTTGILSVDLADRQLYLTDGVNAALDWNQCRTYDQSATWSLDWNQRTLIDGNTLEASLDWQNRVLYDEDGFGSVNWDTYQMGFAGDPAFGSPPIVTVDWINMRLYSNAGGIGNRLSVDWNGHTLSDNSGVLSVNWDGRTMYEPVNGAITVDWANCVLGATNVDGTPCLNWNSRLLYDSFSATSLDWANRQLLDPSGTPIIDWSLGLIYDTLQEEATSIDFGNRNLVDDLGNTSVSWIGRVLNDVFGNSSVDWDGRFLYDSTDNPSVDYGNRQLIDSTGGIVMLDWSNTDGRLAFTGGVGVDGAWAISADGSMDMATDNFLVDVNGNLSCGSILFDFGSGTSDGSGGLNNAGAGGTYSISGADGGALFGKLKLATLGSAPTGTSGQIYFDGTNLKLYTGGAWKTFTVS